MKRWAVILFAIVGVGLGMVLVGAISLKPRVLGHYLMMEHEAHAEFADKASAYNCAELRLFALTNYLGFLEDYRGLLLLETNDFNYAILLTHGRLFNLFAQMNDDFHAQQHFLAASNSFYLLKGRQMEKQLLLTNESFQVEGGECALTHNGVPHKH